MFKQKHTDVKFLLDPTTVDQFVEKEYTVKGWLRSIRNQSKMSFAVLSDGSCSDSLQIIFSPDLLDIKELVEKGTTGTSLSVTGKLIKSPAKGQLVELQASAYTIYGSVENPDTYPMSKKDHSMEHMRKFMHLRARTGIFGSVFRIRSGLTFAIHEYYKKFGFHHVELPFLTGSECEGGSQAFLVTRLLESKKIVDIPAIDNQVDFKKDFFETPTYLTVSAQLHLEALTLALSKAYTFTRFFRAEPSDSYKHVAEGTMVEHEFCFCELSDNIDLTEGLIKFCINYVLEYCYDDIKFLDKMKKGLVDELQKIVIEPFVRTTHAEMITVMKQHSSEGKVKFEHPPEYDDDLSSEHERYITEKIFNRVPVVVQKFPRKVKAFYMPVVKETPEESHGVEHVECFDLLIPRIGELVGGSQRTWSYNDLMTRLDELKMDKSVLEFYTDLRKYGSVPHGGMGIGIDRLCMLATGMDNIRDVIAFPRSWKDCKY